MKKIKNDPTMPWKENGCFTPLKNNEITKAETSEITGGAVEFMITEDCMDF